MRKNLLLSLIIIICISNFTFAKEYNYTVAIPGNYGSSRDDEVTLDLSRTAFLGSVFLVESLYESCVAITFLGIDSNNNIHLKRTTHKKDFLDSIEYLIFKNNPQEHIFLAMLYTVIEISVFPTNNSQIQIKLLPNKYIKEP